MPEFSYEELLPVGPDTTKYRLVSKEGISTFTADGREFLKVSADAISKLTEAAIHDISHYLRGEHLQQLADILKDPESSPNDRFVALDLLKNANIAAGGILPMCQDTGTAIVMGKKGQHVLTESRDEASISRGVYDAFTKLNLRYSQLAAVTTWEERTLEIICLPKLRFTPIASIQMSTTSSSSQKVAVAQINLSSTKRQKRC